MKSNQQSMPSAAFEQPGLSQVGFSQPGISQPAIGEKDSQTVTADFQVLRSGLQGVQCKEMRHIITKNGVSTEMYRADWGLESGTIAQALHVSLRAGAISAWHCHQRQTDHIFCVLGTMRLVLFDDREHSPTRGEVQELYLSDRRPMLVVIPTRVWHGIQNLTQQDVIFCNFFDRVYDHSDPDEWRLPFDSDQIPYQFKK